MYFFDLFDYYNSGGLNSWNEQEYSYLVGCASSYKSTDFTDQSATARETANAFLKAVNQWYLTATLSGYTQALDNGCSPSYADLYDEYNQTVINFFIRRAEFWGTIILHTYYYETTLELSPGSIGFSLGTTHNDWISYYITNEEYYTGSTNTDVRIYNPYTNTPEDVTVTIDYGTSFEQSDFVTKVDNYENSLKEMMCAVKNLLSGIDGDTFDELVVDESGDFVPNSGTTYCFI